MLFVSRVKNKITRWFKKDFYFYKNFLGADRKIFTHLTDEEKKLLHVLSKHYVKKHAVVVEIGSYLGASSCFLANGLISNQGTLYCVDTWENDAMTEGKRDTFAQFVNNTKRYKDIIKPLKGRSNIVVELFKDMSKKIDFLFIDGDHNYIGCKSDWDNYSPFLVRGSLVAFHDTGWADGVKRVVKEDVQEKHKKIFELPNMQVFQIN